MNIVEIVILALGLAMDAFAVAVTIGLGIFRFNFTKALIVGLYFGVFQAGMPVIGYAAGISFAGLVTTFSYWIAFGLLVILGVKMIYSSVKAKDNEKDAPEASLGFAAMLPLSLATSIDAMAVGVSLAFLYVNIIAAAAIIGVITLFVSMMGVKIGNAFGARFKNKAEFAGGVILVLMGVWILL